MLMATQNTQIRDRIERLARLAALPADAVLPTPDAALYSGVATSTWERLRAKRETPPAIHLTSRTLGYRKRDLDARLDSLTEAA
jgi:predicted DNA-binding transcriptional regulator AlpA